MKNYIGTRNESSLHNSLKKYFSEPEDTNEERIEKFIIDIVKPTGLVEIQTGSFSSLKKKLKALLPFYKVTVLYPIPVIKWIIMADKNGEIIRKRKSPKRGVVLDSFDELIRIHEFIAHENFQFKIVKVVINEIRCDDGKGSWRKKGIRTIDKELIDCVETISYHFPKEYLNLIPITLPEKFNTKKLAKLLSVRDNKARKIVYFYKKINLIKKIGRDKDGIIYQR